MTERTIKLVDLCCEAANWQDSIDSNKQTLTELHRDSTSRYFYEREVEEWSARRDGVLTKLRATMDGLTDYEKDWVRRKCKGYELAEQFRELGIEPNWVPNEITSSDHVAV